MLHARRGKCEKQGWRRGRWGQMQSQQQAAAELPESLKQVVHQRCPWSGQGLGAGRGACGRCSFWSLRQFPLQADSGSSLPAGAQAASGRVPPAQQSVLADAAFSNAPEKETNL